MCRFTYLWIYYLLLVCGLVRDWTHNLDVIGTRLWPTDSSARAVLVRFLEQCLAYIKHSVNMNYFYSYFVISFFFYCYSITVVCLFSPSLHPTPGLLFLTSHILDLLFGDVVPMYTRNYNHKLNEKRYF